ncbi:MAG: hypothetical protein HOK30_10415 [Rhodospirillaceae bacterium]|jgi:hypothetical protein|nr:hypothetical protein [Rhodospirillaceae bacterium]MBT5190762.1 hypothetical protein [Rhodospirillaceae bacterium]MBT5898326.1 hypothetical protein [Rhodospirillaceae bacterium]MBT6428064.1 hypothetical protein [Rhodospirillaceae bacterium]MBT7759697.1 hypothetical protein [Rhodospirillaceae bacterium]
MFGWLRAVLLVAVALNGAGCTAVAVKLVDEVDSTVSKLVQSDCEIIRVIHGMNICRSDGSQAVMPAAYCYRTLGGVDCYDRADPGDRPITRHATRATAGLE